MDIKYLLLPVVLSSLVSAATPCSPSDVMNSLIPGAEWKMDNEDLGTLTITGGTVQPIPTQTQVNAAIASCQSNFKTPQQKWSTCVSANAVPNAASNANLIHCVAKQMGLE